jgi:hypothetical protein
VSKSSMSIAPGVIVEMVGNDVVVMVPESAEVIRLSGDAAHTIRAIHAGDVSVLPSHIVDELLEGGILISQAGMSRRGVLTAGALGAGAGIAALTMPSVAAASSPVTSAVSLNGFLSAGRWTETPGAYENIEETLGISGSATPWVATIELLEDPPYSSEGLSNDDPVRDGSTPMAGTLSTGGKTYDAYLYVYDGDLVWWLLGTWDGSDDSSGNPQTNDDFVLTFTFGGKPYEVIPGEI